MCIRDAPYTTRTCEHAIVQHDTDCDMKTRDDDSTNTPKHAANPANTTRPDTHATMSQHGPTRILTNQTRWNTQKPRLGSANLCPAAVRPMSRSEPGAHQERTRSGPGAHKEWARSAPGVGQERTPTPPSQHNTPSSKPPSTQSNTRAPREHAPQTRTQKP